MTPPLAAMLTGTRPFLGLSLPFCLPVIATRPIVLSIGASRSGRPLSGDFGLASSPKSLLVETSKTQKPQKLL
jgi:hypothetical protein